MPFVSLINNTYNIMLQKTDGYEYCKNCVKIRVLKKYMNLGRSLMVNKIIGLGAIGVGVIIAGIGIFLKIKKNIAVSIIGGEDGPTSVFVAGKFGREQSIFGILVGIILFTVGTVLVFKKR